MEGIITMGQKGNNN